MSSSTRSKSASQSSPPTGSATDATEAAAPDDEDEDEGDDDADAAFTPVVVELEVSRQRSVTWAIGGTAAGALFITQLGTVGVWAGIFLCVVALMHAVNVVQSMMYPPGVIAVTATSVTLPRGLCKPNPLELKPADVTAAYFLRRSVPWNKSSPVLIVEVGPRAIVFPRDWFASERDQRQVIGALLHGRN
jgi:hypothetical protein